MSGAEWIADKINSPEELGRRQATIVCAEVVFVQRSGKPDAYVGVVPTTRKDPAPVVSLTQAKEVCAKEPRMEMMIAIPRSARWSGAAMRWLEAEGIAFGGVGDLLSAISYDDEISTHRNKTFAFVNDGLLKHSRVRELEWLDSKRVEVRLKNDKKFTVALEDAYDITMDVAREAARTLGEFDILLKINPNGSITSDGADNVERLGFRTLKWGELFGYLAKHSGQASYDDLRERLRRAKAST